MMEKFFAYLFVTVTFAIQANGQVNWTKYPVNPVLPKGVSDEWDDALVANPYVLFNGTDYQMWYAGYDGSTSTNIGYATSPDGITWTKYSGNPVLTTGPAGSWDDVTDYQPSVIFDGTTYHMWFGGHEGTNRRIGYATSPDGINWTKYSGNPVLTTGPAGSWDNLWVDSPNVLYKDGLYHMYYSGNDGSITQSGHATSLDGITWDKDTLNPVLKVESGEWDDIMCYQPSVLFDGNMYHMWYSGGGAFLWRIGYTYSFDGRNWFKAAYNPVLEPGSSGSWDDTYAGLCGVIFNEDSSGFKMWYTGGTGFVTGDIGYATAPIALIDFENNPLIKYHNNPVLLKGSEGEWNSKIVENPYLLFDGSVYHMWYAGSDGTGLRIGYAHSSDGINWIQYDDPTTTTPPYANSDPILINGSTGSWDAFHVLQPSVIFDGTSYHMWFGGIGNSSFTDRNIGYATSPDTIHWTEYNGNPLVEPGPLGSWDDEWVDSPNVLFINGVYHMWYCGFDGAYVQTGHATSLDGITWDKDTLNPVLKVGAPGSWDSFWAYQPFVLFDGKVYHMFYSGSSSSGAFQWTTGYAYSFDGSNWIKYNDPTTTTTLYAESDTILSTGPSGSWDDTYAGQSSVIFNYDSAGSITGFKMWYGGGNGNGTGDIGFAASVPIDGVHPIANFTADTTIGEKPLTVQFNESSTGYILGWLWDFGDGETSTEQNPSHTYKTVDTFSVSLTVSGLVGSDTKTIENYIIVDPITGIDDNATDIPDKFALMQNYPNPFNPSTKIRYEVPTTGLVSLRVFNLLGEVIATLVNEEKPAGTYELTWNASNLPSGVYFYKLQADNFVETKKMLLLK